MKPWIELGRAKIPGSTDILRLKQRDTEFSIMLGSNELMNSRLSGSEEAMATMARDRLPAETHAPEILIGGLGMGFTLRAALKTMPEAHITVAELVPEVADWARGPMAAFHAGSLDGPRVDVHIGDVGPLIRSRKAAWDIILLDVDNGPEGLSRRENDAIYSDAGIAAAEAALRPGGVLSVWSATPHAGFSRKLKRSRLAFEECQVKADRGRRGARHTLWFGRKG